MIIIAHNIRSLHNVGSIFRSADAFRLEKIYLTGYTGKPPRKEIHKTALGSEDIVPWESSEDVFQVIDKLKKQDFSVYGLETGEKSTEIGKIDKSKRIALILGNEVNGIEPDVIERTDGLIEIPMPGRKRSLNVSVAAGIAMFELGRW